MAKAITIRGIDDAVHDALRRRATRAGRSVEGEVRAILAAACMPPGAVDWAAGLRRRALARSAGTPQIDSADLIRAARDER